MPYTVGRTPTKEEMDELAAWVKEAAINQSIAAIKANPFLSDYVRRLLADGELGPQETEALRRIDAEENDDG